MVNWALVAAYIGPLLVAIGLVSAWFQRSAKKRDERVAGQIATVSNDLVTNQKLQQQQIDQMKEALAQQTKHLDQQDQTMAIALQSIARIEGRLAGPITVTTSD